MQEESNVDISEQYAENEENTILNTDGNKTVKKSCWVPFKETLVNFTLLGFTNFGGTIGLIQKQFVEEKQWVTNEKLIELYGLAQSLPGANICKVIIGIGMLRNGFWNGILGNILYCFPGFVGLLLIGWLQNLKIQITIPYWLQNAHIGLICSGIAFSMLATWKLSISIVKIQFLKIIACIVCMIALLYRPIWFLPISIVFGSLISLLYFSVKEEKSIQETKEEVLSTQETNNHIIPVWIGILFIIVFLVILVLLFVSQIFVQWEPLLIMEYFFRMGTLIIGGGQTGILLLRDEMILKGWISEIQFINGFSLSNALPGPKFNIAAYLGAAMGGFKYGLVYGIISGIMFFLPGTLLYIGMLPIWEKVKNSSLIKKLILGLNAVVIGYVIATVIELWMQHIKLYPVHIVSTVFSLALLAIFDLHAILVVVFSMLFTLVVGLFIQLE